MSEISRLERARQVIGQTVIDNSAGEQFSVDDFSKRSVERLVTAMEKVRESEIQTDQ